MAIAILVTLIVAVGGVLTSSVAAHAVARERTGAEQCVNAQVEVIRAKAYDKVGTPRGQPAGGDPAHEPVQRHQRHRQRLHRLHRRPDADELRDRRELQEGDDQGPP